MKKFIFFLPLALGAVTSNAKIQHPAGGSVTSVKTLVWGFKKGDITHYPRPSISGTPLTTWQVDNVTRWSDGTVKLATVSFPVTITDGNEVTVTWVDAGSCSGTCGASDRRASSTGSGLTSQQMLDFNSASWDMQIKLTYNGATQTASARTILQDDVTAGRACGDTSSNCTYWLKGPVVTEMILQGPLDDETHFFDYTMGFDQGHTGGNNKPVRPRFEVRAYPSFTTGVREVGTILGDMSTRLETLSFNIDYLTGAAHGTNIYSKGGTCDSLTNCGMIFSTTSAFRKVAWDGATPTYIDTSYYNVPYKSSAGLLPNWDPNLEVSVPTSPAVPFWQTKWDNTDHCLDYNSFGGLTQAFGVTGGRWDLGPTPHPMSLAIFAPLQTSGTNLRSVALGISDCSSLWPAHLLNTKTGLTTKFCPNTCTGGNATVSAFARFPTPEAFPTFIGGVYENCWHFVDSAVSAADKITPIYINPTNNMGTINKWGLDSAHHPDLWYVSYLMSDGDYYYYSEAVNWGLYTFASMSNNYWVGGHHKFWGIMTYQNLQTRGYAWVHRHRGNLLTMIDQTDPTYQMLIEHWKLDARVGEGAYNITNGNYPPNDSTCASFNPATSNSILTSDDDVWCWGKKIVATMNDGTHGELQTNDNSLPFVGPRRAANKASDYPIDMSTTVAIAPPWMGYYKQIIAFWNLQREFTYESAVYNAEVKGSLKIYGENKWLMTEGESPTTKVTTCGPGLDGGAGTYICGAWINTSAEFVAAWRPASQGYIQPVGNCVTNPANTPFDYAAVKAGGQFRCTQVYALPQTCCHTQETYAFILRGTIAGWSGISTTGLDGVTNLTGDAAWAWISDPATKANGAFNQDPRYSMVPINLSPPGTLTATPTSLSYNCTLTGSNPANQNIAIAASGITLDNWSGGENVSWFSLSPTSGSSAGNTAGVVSCSGLTAGSYSDLVTFSSTTTGILNQATVTLSLTVYDAPVITTIGVPAGLNGVAYSTTLAATGGAPSLTWSITSGALPTGLTMSSGGVISGTPTASGNFGITVQVSDANSVTNSKFFTLGIGGTPGATYSKLTMSR